MRSNELQHTFAFCTHFVAHTARHKIHNWYNLPWSLTCAMKTAEMWPRVEIWNINNTTTTLHKMLMLTGVQLVPCSMYRRAHRERVPSVIMYIYMHGCYSFLLHAVSTFTPLQQFKYRNEPWCVRQTWCSIICVCCAQSIPITPPMTIAITMPLRPPNPMSSPQSTCVCEESYNRKQFIRLRYVRI